MRILVVSAHYPPNFVSGGTLVPQRLARGLRARGHDVSVYAGHLDARRRPLDTWDDEDETGLPVRWIVTTPWTAWEDPRNFDNGPVADDFARHVRAVRPDVVHLHALQSLGGGLVRAAADAGAKIVVTAHDFWWQCARQFLVDRAMQPCPLVVAAGDCACQVDRAWLERRDRWLAGQLARADVVLAPSASAAAVLAANGVDPARLDVDENGLPPRDDHDGSAVDDDAAVPSHTRAAGGDVRFLYTGGPDEMKGVHVLFEAARRLEATPGWRLSAYGAADWVRRTGFELGSLPVDVLDPYPPELTGAVMTSNDVLVVPSVMRESHSLVTREALTRGMPVVCTDTLGPEEVVDHDVNGIVVPAADPEALARALRRLIAEPDTLARLRAASRAVVARSLDDQLDGLERRYAELVHAPARTRASTTASVSHVLFVCGIEGAPLRYRARLPAEALALEGITSEVRHFFDPELTRLARDADAVVLYRVPATRAILDLVDECHQHDVPALFDADDLIFDPDIADEIPALSILAPDAGAMWMDGVRRYRTTMEACDAYIASTPLLARHAAAVTKLPTERFDNGVGILMARLAHDARRRPRRPGPLRIGYLSGTDTHDRDWAMIEPAVIDLLATRPSLELWLGGLLPETPALEPFDARVRRLPFLHWRRLPGVLRDLDVNLAPLELPSRFNDAKSAIKWLEAGLAGTPSVASPTEPYRAAVRDGETGILASSPEEWSRGIACLLDREDLRWRMGSAAGRDALLRWSPPLQGRRYRELLERAAARARDGRTAHSSTWTPSVVDEQPRPKVLEPYRLGDERVDRVLHTARTLGAWERYGAARLRASVAEDGYGATARRLGRAAQRAVRRTRVRG